MYMTLKLNYVILEITKDTLAGRLSKVLQVASPSLTLPLSVHRVRQTETTVNQHWWQMMNTRSQGRRLGLERGRTKTVCPMMEQKTQLDPLVRVYRSLQTLFTDFDCRNDQNSTPWFLTSLFHGGGKRHFGGLSPHAQAERRHCQWWHRLLITGRVRCSPVWVYLKRLFYDILTLSTSSPKHWVRLTFPPVRLL